MQDLRKQKEEKTRDEKLRQAKENMEHTRAKVIKFITTPEKDIAIIIRAYGDFVRGLTDEQKKQVRTSVFNNRVYECLPDIFVVNAFVVQEMAQIELCYNVKFDKKLFRKIYIILDDAYKKEMDLYYRALYDILQKVDNKISWQVEKVDKLFEL